MRRCGHRVRSGVCPPATGAAALQTGRGRPRGHGCLRWPRRPSTSAEYPIRVTLDDRTVDRPGPLAGLVGGQGGGGDVSLGASERSTIGVWLRRDQVREVRRRHQATVRMHLRNTCRSGVRPAACGCLMRPASAEHQLVAMSLMPPLDVVRPQAHPYVAGLLPDFRLPGLRRAVTSARTPASEVAVESAGSCVRRSPWADAGEGR